MILAVVQVNLKLGRGLGPLPLGHDHFQIEKPNAGFADCCSGKKALKTVC